MVANTSDIPIKYIYYTVNAYNRVGDKASDSISGRYEKTLEFTGPLNPGQIVGPTRWANTWYNNTIQCGTIINVKIVYMTGAERILDGDQIQPILRGTACQQFY